MALDLFVNFERSSNNKLFYRLTSSTSTTFTVKLSDLEEPNLDLSELYTAKLSLNEGPLIAFNFNESIQFDTSSPCVCSINIQLYNLENELTDVFDLSGVFLNEFPSVDFVAYPDKYIDEATSVFVNLNSTNYLTSPGVYFYGEGHTEIINLSASGISNGCTATWFVGNDIDGIFPFATSVLPVVSVTPSTATVSVTTVSFDTRSYPISLRATNSNITEEGPIIAYNDSTGVQEFYPFFATTRPGMVVQNNENSEFRDSIMVLPYPSVNAQFVSPFNSNHLSLPLTYNSQLFNSTFSCYVDYGDFITKNYIGSIWELEADSSIEQEIPDWIIQTPFLSGKNAYQFYLSYDRTSNEIYLPELNASPNVPTTITLMVSGFEDVGINLASDWITRRVCSIFTASVIIDPIPLPKIYTPNYYNTKNQDVQFAVVSNPFSGSELKSITLQSPYSLASLVLSGASLSALSGTMQFNTVGLMDLSATVVSIDAHYQTEHTVTKILTNFLEVVDEYESEPEEDYFQTALTPLKLTYGYQPKLTPNEWAVEDTINSIIEKLYTTIDDLDDYTKLYEEKNKFYGWLGPKARPLTIYNTETSAPTYTWQDLECSDFLDSETENFAVWSEFESVSPALTKTWEYHECVKAQSDPKCLQKYCLEWKWKTRKYGLSDTNVTWKSTKKGAQYAKKWFFEKCESDSNPLPCDQDTWKISTIDPGFFPVPYCDSVANCLIVDAEINNQTNQMVIAFPSELKLVNTDYFATYVARQGQIDDLFSFQNIAGLSINTEGKVIVLDNAIPKVSVFKIFDNNFTLFSTWGGYGLSANPRGFNKPQDIHVDDKNFVWIADTGNKCIKKFTITGIPLMTITHETLDLSAPLSVCVDSKSNVHCLTEKSVHVFDSKGTFLFSYNLPEDVTGAKKINTSYNKEMIYITYATGVIKYFRTGVISHYTIQDLECTNKEILQNYNSISQDKFRNIYVTVGDKILKIPDLQKIVESKAALPADLYWSLNDLLIHKEEYIQPWVYLKSFHRLWDNIELFRNSLFYNLEGCKSYTKPTYMKSDLIIGQNEIVTNAVINRIAEQLWTNLQGLINYFDPNCEN
jgi:hypothetical protein